MTDTKPIIVNVKICSKCSNTKDVTLFIKERNICKSCDNNRKKLQYHNSGESAGDKMCNQCSISKDISEFIKNRNICKVCNNNRRKHKYQTDEEHRKHLIQHATDFKIKKKEERHDIKSLLQEIIGIGNKKCNYCFEIKSNNRFRTNRVKCKDCERDHPESKFIRNIRSRIHTGLTRSTKKSKHTIEYLGCTMDEYFKWIMTYNENYNIDNYGKAWHIDHVIPVSKFDLWNTEQQLFAFNWMNTMPLSCKENLQKNNKIITSQVLEHFEKIKKYHVDNNWEIPNKHINLYATYLDVLEPP
jgi:uncharacterized protein (DUF983 family)